MLRVELSYIEWAHLSSLELMLDWKLKFTPYLEQAIEGRKWCKPRTKGAENEILVILLAPEPLTHPETPFPRGIE